MPETLTPDTPDAPDPLDRRLSALLAEPGTEPALARTHRRIRRRRTTRQVAAGLGVIVLLALAGLAGTRLLVEDEGADRITTEPERPEPEQAEDGFPSEPGWHRLADLPGPARQEDARVWTGEELVVWGGRQAGDGPPLDTGVRYVPGQDEWIELPPAPLPGGPSVGVAAEDGTFVVVDQDPDSGELLAASWDGERWTELPSGPTLDERWGVTVGVPDVVWADGALVLPQPGLVLDRSLTWQELPEPPVELTESHAAWTGSVVAVAGRTGAPGTLAGDAVLLLYDPAERSWEQVEPAPLRAQAIDAAWNGWGVVVTSYEGDAAAYDLDAGRWEPMDDIPLNTGECSPSTTTFGPGGDDPTVAAVALCGGLAIADGGLGWVPLAGPGGAQDVYDALGTRGGLMTVTVDFQRPQDPAGVWFLRVGVEEGVADLDPPPGLLAVDHLSFELPEGARFVAASVEEQSVVRTVSLELASGEGPCTISSTYLAARTDLDRYLAVEGASPVDLDVADGTTVEAAAVPPGGLDDRAHLFWVFPERANLEEVVCPTIDGAELVAGGLRLPS